MRILSLDLATATGWAIGESGKTPSAGTISLASSSEVTAWGKQRLTRRQDPRCPRLYNHLTALAQTDFHPPDIIVFEDVEFMSYTQQCQLWSSLRATVWLFSHFHGTRLIDCLNVTKLKKFATGFGVADKETMARHLFKKYPHWRNKGLDDNGVDALWLWYWAEQNFARFQVTPKRDL